MKQLRAPKFTFPNRAFPNRVLTICLPSNRPLLTLWTVRSLLDLPDKKVELMIEDGQLPFAFNIARQTTSKKVARVWFHSIVEIQNSGKARHDTSFEIVLASILPNRPRFRATEIGRLFSCDSEHVANLIDAGELVQNGSTRKCNESKFVTHSSVEKFLERRRIL